MATLDIREVPIPAVIRALLEALSDTSFLTDADRQVLSGALQRSIYDPEAKNQQILTIGDILDENDGVSNSATKAWSQRAAKFYVDALILSLTTQLSHLGSPVVIRGEWQASSGAFPDGANTPKGSTTAGDSYVISTGGDVGGETFDRKDRIIALVDNASTTTFEGNWFKADYTDSVTAVAGLAGAITAAALRTALNVEDGAQVNFTGAALISAINDALGQSTWQGGAGSGGASPATASDIASIAASINTAGKFEGKLVWDRTSFRLMIAAGSAPESPWYTADGSISVTPQAGGSAAIISQDPNDTPPSEAAFGKFLGAFAAGLGQSNEF